MLINCPYITGFLEVLLMMVTSLKLKHIDVNNCFGYCIPNSFSIVLMLQIRFKSTTICKGQTFSLYISWRQKILMQFWYSFLEVFI